MMKMFIFCGIILTITMGAFMAMIFTSGMKNGWGRGIVSVVLACAIGFGVVGLFQMEHNADVKDWNNGVCICGADYELFDIEHLRNSGELYYWRCDNGHVITTHCNFVKKA